MRNSFADSRPVVIEGLIATSGRRCRVCRATLPDDARWCGRCGVNTLSHVHGRLAGPVRRLAGAIVDWAVPVGAFVLTSSRADGTDIFTLILLAYAPCALILYSAGTTPGKRLFGMRVICDDGLPATLGRMVVREWGAKVISACAFGLGLLGILVDRERRALHDRIVGTYVIN
jgi:uncharacterized RDD family membrane protein YckC